MQTPTFKPLDSIDNLLAPQLEYIVKCWNAIDDCGLELANQFMDHYNYHHFNPAERLEAFINDTMIQSVLTVYNLDAEKFWYLLLMVVNYVEGYAPDTTHDKVPSVQLDKAFSLIEANLDKHDMAPMGFKFVHDSEMKLTLTVKQPGKKNRTRVDINTPNALAYLTYLYRKVSEQEMPQFMNEAIGFNWFENAAVPQTIKLAVFAKILYYFLKPLEAAPGIVSRDIPIDKYYLISQLAYLMELTSDDRFIDPTRPRYLRDYTKDCGDVDIMAFNQHYNFDFMFE